MSGAEDAQWQLKNAVPATEFRELAVERLAQSENAF
jgi:hypothetical protein